MLPTPSTGPANAGVAPAAFDHAGCFSCRYDRTQAILLIEARGRWTVEQVDRVCEDAAIIVGQMRDRGEPVRVLVDRSCTEVQSHAASERLLAHTGRIYEAEDRIAVVVDSSLAKTQSRSSVDGRTHQVFASRHAAMTWLKAHD